MALLTKSIFRDIFGRTTGSPFGTGLLRISGAALYYLRNYLNGTAEIGEDAIFTCASARNVRAFDATTGLKLVSVPADVEAAEGMRYDSGIWYNSVSDVDSTQLHPTNATGVYISMPAWPGAAQEVSLDAYAVGKVGNHYHYYKCTTAGTTDSTEPTWADSGIVADNDVVWTYQGRYSNLGPVVVPHVLHEPAATNYIIQSSNLTDAAFGKSGSATVVANGDMYDISVSTADYALRQLRTIALDAPYTPSLLVSQGTGVLKIQNPYTPLLGVALVDLSLVVGTEKVCPKHPAMTITTPFVSNSSGGSGYIVYANAGTVNATVNKLQIELGDTATSYILTTTAPVTRAATNQSGAIILGSKTYLRYWPREISNLVDLLSDGTNKLTYSGTALEFTDGVTTLSHACTPALGDVVGLDLTAGAWKLYLNGSEVDTAAGSAVTWAATIYLGVDSTSGAEINGGVTDLRSGHTIDLTDLTWRDKA
jgi:hypothetical protein